MGRRTRRRLSQIDGRRAASSGSAPGLHVHGRREGRKTLHSWCEREGDESCAQYGGSEEDDGVNGFAGRLMAWLREIGLESVDIIVEVRQRTGVDKFDCVMEHE